MRFLVLALLCLAAPGPLAAQTPPLSAEAAVGLAVRHNPRLLAAAREVLSARVGVRSAGALTNPTFVFAPGLTSLSGSGDELLLSQPLEVNGTRSARAGVASAQLRITQAEATVELRNLVFETRSAYHQLQQARELQALAREVLANAQDFDRVTRLLVEGGRRPGIDLAQTGIEVVRAEQQVALADAQESVARAALNTLLNQLPDAPVGLLSPLGPAAVAPVDEALLAGQALTSRAEIARAQAAQESFRQEARLARAEGRPDLAPQVRFGSLIRGVPEGSSGNGFGIGLGITLPFFDHGSRRNRVRQAEESARAQADRVAAAQNQVRQEVAQAAARLRAAQAISGNYQQGVLDRARRLLEGSRTALREGAAGTSILTVLEAQRTYRAVQTDYINALVNQALARAELERAAGAVPASLLPPIAPGTGRTK